MMLTVSRMSSSQVGNGTIIMPTIAPTQATRIRSLKRVKTPIRLPATISFFNPRARVCIFSSTLAIRIAQSKPRRNASG